MNICSNLQTEKKELSRISFICLIWFVSRRSSSGTPEPLRFKSPIPKSVDRSRSRQLEAKRDRREWERKIKRHFIIPKAQENENKSFPRQTSRRKTENRRKKELFNHLICWFLSVRMEIKQLALRSPIEWNVNWIFFYDYLLERDWR